MGSVISFFGNLVPILGTVSLKASLLAGFLILIRMIFIACRQHRYAHLIWLILLFRLCLPLDIATPMSPFRFPSVDSIFFAAGAETAAVHTADIESTVEHESLNDNGHASPSMVPAAPITSPAFTILGVIWMAGVVFFCMRFLRLHCRHRRRLAAGRPVTDKDLLDIFRECAALAKIRRRVTLIQTNVPGTPYTYDLIWRDSEITCDTAASDG